MTLIMPHDLLFTLISIIILLAITSGLMVYFRVPHKLAPLWAILRGVIQLGLISFVLTGVIAHRGWVALALVVMFSVATYTAGKRIGGGGRNLVMMGTAIGAGVVVSMAVIFSTGALDFSARYLLAIGGIVTGGAMTTSTLAARTFSQRTHGEWDQVEAWLSLGATPRQSTREIVRNSIYAAMIPNLDQTKTTGLVTLPGAFVGAIFGGISPLDAGRFQVMVLAAIMCAGCIGAVIVTAWLAPVKYQPVRVD